MFRKKGNEKNWGSVIRNLFAAARHAWFLPPSLAKVSASEVDIYQVFFFDLGFASSGPEYSLILFDHNDMKI